MTTTTLMNALLYAALCNVGLLIVWAIVWIGARDAVFRWHSKWFAIDRHDFERIHYLGMASYEMLIFCFFIVPYLALRIVN